MIKISKYIKIPSNFFELKEIKKLEEYKQRNILLVTLLNIITKVGKSKKKNIFEVNKNLNLTDEILSCLLNLEINQWKECRDILVNEKIINISGSKLYLKDFWRNSRNRSSDEYTQWRLSVFERDNYTCMDCGTKGGRLNAHHIVRWADDVSKRYDVENGITLCEECHKSRHRK